MIELDFIHFLYDWLDVNFWKYPYTFLKIFFLGKLFLFFYKEKQILINSHNKLIFYMHSDLE